MTKTKKKTTNQSRWILALTMCLIITAALIGTEPAFAVTKGAFQKSQVKNVKVAAASYNSVSVTWTSTPGANGYYVYVSPTHHGTYKKAKTVKKGTTTSAKIGNRVTGKTYYYKVQAYMGSGSKRVLNKASFSKAGTAVPTKPTVTLKAVEALAPATKIKISYSKVSGASGYEIYRSTSETKNFKKIKAVGSGTHSVTDQTAKENTKYFYKVRAYRTVKGKKVYGIYSKTQDVIFTRLAGNAEKYNAKNIAKAGPDLSGHTVYFLGSSVTRGRGGEGQSFADQLVVRNKLTTAVKEAIDGTTLAMIGDNKSYVERLQALPKASPDVLVCQLSSNDARKGVKLGKIASGYNISEFNTATVTGSLEYILAYAEQNWNCPVVFYTLPRFASDYFNDEEYQKMVTRLGEVTAKWASKYENVYTLDLWNDAAVNAELDANRALYMADAIHPTKAGYLNLYTPGMADLLNIAMTPGQAQDVGSGKGVCIDLNEDVQEPLEIGSDGLPLDDTLQP